LKRVIDEVPVGNDDDDRDQDDDTEGQGYEAELSLKTSGPSLGKPSIGKLFVVRGPRAPSQVRMWAAT
jgi:hypothetical protein